uniref:Uncharacterized protein n=1 Tax=Anguilla anguilla TaxID=7936 RepID=A0A0E9TYY6_ANGAN
MQSFPTLLKIIWWLTKGDTAIYRALYYLIINTFSVYKNAKLLTHTKHCLKVMHSNWLNLGD